MPKPPQTDPGIIQKYLSDESNIFGADPAGIKGVYCPETPDEARQILAQSAHERMQVTISGGGTGLTGARVPLSGGIIISTEKMLKAPDRDGFEMLDTTTMAGDVRIGLGVEHKTAWVPAGISLNVLSEVLPGNLFYPPDPTESSALLGGTIATNASGARSYHFGPTRKWVRELQVMVANGDVLSLPRGRFSADSQGVLDLRSDSGKKYRVQLPSFTSLDMKNAAGVYVKPGMDAIDLFIGSEGIFGLVTSALIDLAPKPGIILGNATFFADVVDALGFVDAARADKSHGLLAIEFFDRNSLVFMTEKYPNIPSNAQAAVYVELADPDDASLEWLFELAESHHAKGDWSADNEREIQKLKEFRHSLPEGVNSYLKQNQSHKLGTDFVVPAGRFDEMMQAYTQTGEAFAGQFPRGGIHYVLFGHIGDCHLHFNFIAANSQEMAFAKTQYLGLAQKAIALGGTISGEHGVGKKVITVDGREMPYLELMLGPKALQEICATKKVLDPDWILNIGNMVGNRVPG